MQLFKTPKVSWVRKNKKYLKKDVKRIEYSLEFEKRRDFTLTTPCCNSNNKDGKFVNYKDLPKHYGYCHSCGKATLPPAIYENDTGDKFIWDDFAKRYVPYEESIVENLPAKKAKTKVLQKFIDEDEVWKHYQNSNENNLLKYLRTNYSKDLVDEVKHMYMIGTNETGGTMFWKCNKKAHVCKLKVMYYDSNGKRLDKFNVPYKNEGGYYDCLFGEHLIIDNCKGSQILVLVESEKTAIIGSMLINKLPGMASKNITWLAYGGLNGLTEEKAKSLIGRKVLAIPDISSKAVATLLQKESLFRNMGIDFNVWDTTNGLNDKELKSLSLYNKDLEDLFRDLQGHKNSQWHLLFD